MADIEYTHSAFDYLSISGRVGQTVEITIVTGTPPSSFNLLRPLPAGLFLANNIIQGTLLMAESAVYNVGGAGPYFIWSYQGIDYEKGGAYNILPALAEPTPPSTVNVDDLAAILAALNLGGGGGGTTTVDPNLPPPDPTGGLTGTNAEGDISVPVDFDLTTDQVFIPNGFSLPTAGEASPIALPDWAPGTFSIGSILSVKEGDRFPIAIGFLRPSELIEVGGITSIKVFARERAGERLLELSETGHVLMAGVTRYKVVLNLQSAALRSILRSYESPNGAYVDLMCEIRLTVTIPAVGSAPESVLVRTSHTFALRFEQKMGS